MKNVLKKIAATALAFTLLGTGSAITTSSKSKNTFTATAASCKHNCRRYSHHIDKGETHYTYGWFANSLICTGCYTDYTEYIYCSGCNNFLYTRNYTLRNW
ncbi:hypothetical protein SAMN04487860_11239 [Ruminococcus flavefaciens]|uniref:Uncharacterized protein n=1 Tax=Ruminococcus flavefaciens TaxID=1265 RepID=A0A1M7L8P9_RUMFL|nr:hypothetical protein SAMN04487860_11239 [Ruminococcus flavefaciens]